MRLKRYIEMRGSDGGPWRRLPSLPAFWVGLIYDDANLDACWDIVKDWTAEERQKLRDDVPRLGFKADDPRRSAARSRRARRLRSPRKGSVRRKRLDRNGRDETRYLRPLQESVARGITPAEELLRKVPRRLERLGRAGVRRVRVLTRHDLAPHLSRVRHRVSKAARLPGIRGIGAMQS